MLTTKISNSRMIQATFVCFAASLFFAYELMQLHMLNAITPMLMRDLHFSATDLGVLGSTYIMADVLFLLPAGIILDRFSVRKVILTALFLCVAGTVGFAFSHTLLEASVAHFFSGIGNAFCFLSCMLLCSRWFPSKWHGFVMGVMLTMGMLGAVLAQTPFSLLAEAFNWRQALLVDASIGCAIFFLVYLFVMDTDPSEQKKGQEVPLLYGIKQALCNKQNIFCGFYTGMMNLPLMLLAAMWGSLFLTQVHDMTLTEASFVTSMIGLGTIVGSPLAGYISDKMGRRKPVMIVGAFLSLVFFLSIVLLTERDPLLFSSLFFALGVATSAQVLGYPLITENNPTEYAGVSLGLAGMIIMGSSLVLQPISGMLIDQNWSGAIVDGMRYYAKSDFMFAFSLFPIGFILSMILSFVIKDRVRG